MPRILRRFTQLLVDARPGQVLTAGADNNPSWLDIPDGCLPMWDGASWSAPQASAVIAPVVEDVVPDLVTPIVEDLLPAATPEITADITVGSPSPNIAVSVQLMASATPASGATALDVYFSTTADGRTPGPSPAGVAPGGASFDSGVILAGHTSGYNGISWSEEDGAGYRTKFSRVLTEDDGSFSFTVYAGGGASTTYLVVILPNKKIVVSDPIIIT